MKKPHTWIAVGLVTVVAGTLGLSQRTAIAQTTTTQPSAAAQTTTATQSSPTAQSSALERSLRAEIDAIYKGDFRAAFVSKKPDLFLKYIPDDFKSESVEGQKFDAAALRQFFPTQFPNMVRTIEHNVSIEDVDVVSANKLSAVVTLNTLIEYKGASGNYLVNTLGTYRDVWEKRNGKWFEIEGNQLRNQTTSYRRP